MSVQALVTSAVPVSIAWSTYSCICAGVYGPLISFWQLDGAGDEHLADQPDTRYRWSGSDQEATGSNMWSSSAKSLA